MAKIIRGIFLALAFYLFSASPGLAAQPQAEIYHLFLTAGDGPYIEVRDQLFFKETLPEGTQLTFTLPEGVQEVQFLQGVPQGSAKIEGDEIKVGNVQPQTDMVSFSYRLPLSGPHAVFGKTINYDSGSFVVIFPAGELTVSGEQLQDGGVQKLGDEEYQLLTRDNVSAGSAINMTVVNNSSSGAPKASQGEGVLSRASVPDFHSTGHIRFWQQSPFRGMNAHLFLILVIVIPILAIILFLRQRRAEQLAVTDRKPAYSSQEAYFQNLVAREKVLKGKLKELEIQHRQGEIQTGDYQVKREAYKKKLIEVRVKLKKFTG